MLLNAFPLQDGFHIFGGFQNFRFLLPVVRDRDGNLDDIWLRERSAAGAEGAVLLCVGELAGLVHRAERQGRYATELPQVVHADELE